MLSRETSLVTLCLPPDCVFLIVVFFDYPNFSLSLICCGNHVPKLATDGPGPQRYAANAADEPTANGLPTTNVRLVLSTTTTMGSTARVRQRTGILCYEHRSAAVTTAATTASAARG